MSMKRHGICRSCFRGHKPQHQQGSKKCLVFTGNKENANKNGKTLLEERISLFDGRTSPIRFFSVDDLNSMDVDKDWYIVGYFHQSYTGTWAGKTVLVKIFCEAEFSRILACREIAVATQMGTHRNVHRLQGCCLGTTYPVLVYQWEENGTLNDRILKYKEQKKEPFEWKDRLRIAWEIAHAVAYLHTAFLKPIIHRDLNPSNIFLDEFNSARLSEFSLCVSIPKGKKHVEEIIMGTRQNVAPESCSSGRVTESSDVFSFGALLLVLLTAKSSSNCKWDQCYCISSDWVSDNIDPVIATSGPVVDEHYQYHLKTLIDLAVRCCAMDAESRPTMVDIARELKNMISSSPDFL